MDSGESLLCAEEMVGSPWIAGPAGRSELSSSRGFPVDSCGFMPGFVVEDDETVAFLLGKELQYMPEACYLAELQSSEIYAERCKAVRWLLKAHTYFNFNPLTAALAVNYLDRYLAKNLSKCCKVWMLELLSVACLSIAAKMEEVDVPALLDLQIDGMDHSFHGATVQRMELTVLSSLGWRLRSVTPFAYVEKALNNFNLSHHQKNSLLARTSELLLGTLPELDFLGYQPSVIAASSICCALEECVPLQAESLKISLSKYIPLDEEKFLCCHRLMEDLVVDPLSPTLSLSGHTKSPHSPTTVILEVYQSEDNSRENVERRLLGSLTCVRKVESDQLVLLSSHTKGNKRQRRH